ncbi:2Fe-2S iron-sulfur cluster-binding protein [Burkholderia pseudomultivorans]|uniref:(2Fe-2S)-binding protein n=1 Tax=Burkholderia pseudomultivorans TaxID=1207504 RepID=A0A132EI87_9BURK|nr:2Fe-2S iron-sulfur cluster-binding protein [Burkholderia pseudomultivorans]KWF30832.1 (2Fe-2S)-binding protein [Burkholderia pseudomultivorans]
MPVIKYVQSNGLVVEADVPLGSSVMQGAVDNMVEGIVAECGGACSCATCEVHVDEAWMRIVGEACDIEKDMLSANGDVLPNCRLSCQIEITPELDGLVVAIPG